MQEEQSRMAERTHAVANMSLAAQLRPLVRTMRPKQWTKNVFVWARWFSIASC